MTVLVLIQAARLAVERGWAINIGKNLFSFSFFCFYNENNTVTVLCGKIELIGTKYHLNLYLLYIIK